jgi:hypothetical protein
LTRAAGREITASGNFEKEALKMPSRATRLVLVALVVGLLAFVVAAPASSYGKATWQTALNGTFNFPGSGTALGFWGWCDFAGGVTSGPDADCQVAEYFHSPAGSGWTCQVSVDGSWTTGPEVFDPTSITFHITGSIAVHGHLTQEQADLCVGFYVYGDAIPYSGRTIADVDTFIPAAPGHYSIPPSALFGPGVVGEFHFQVNRNPTT